MAEVDGLVLFRDLWKKYAVPEQGPVDDALTNPASADIVETQTPEATLAPRHPYHPETAQDAITHPEATPFWTQQYLKQTESFEKETAIKQNLQNLKQLVDEPKEQSPDLRFFHIRNHLKTPEVYETIRQERWQPMIRCPKCQSHNISRIVQMPPQPPDNHRYRCHDCDYEFTDTSGTMLEEPSPPTIQTWIECWFLWGCTDNLKYIAHRLGLDIHTIERMLYLLQQLFNAEKPLSRLDNSPQLEEQSRKLKEKFKLEIQKTYERLNMQLSSIPLDTLQARHRETIRKHGSLDPDLALDPTHKPKRRK